MSRRPRRSARALFTSTLLLSEAMVVLFAGLVVYGLRLAPVPVIVGGGAALALWAVVAGALVRRGTVGYVLGSVLQLALIATGFVVPMMFAVGGIFGVLWLVSLRVGGQIDAERIEREDAEREYEQQHGTGEAAAAG